MKIKIEKIKKPSNNNFFYDQYLPIEETIKFLERIESPDRKLNLKNLINYYWFEIKAILEEGKYSNHLWLIWLKDNEGIYLGHLFFYKNPTFAIKDLETINKYWRIIDGVWSILVDLAIKNLVSQEKIIEITNILENSLTFWKKIIQKYLDEGLINSAKRIPASAEIQKLYFIAYDKIILERK